MCACSKQKQFQFFLLDPVYQKPVRLYMAFSKPGVISCEVMVSILCSQFFAICQCIYDRSK